MKSVYMKAIACLINAVILMTILTGCGGDEKDNGNATPQPTIYATEQPVSTDIPELSDEIIESDEEDETEWSLAEDLDETQLNSLNMLNYLVSMTHEINSSRNNRFYLEEVYSSFHDNWNKETIDGTTKEYIDKVFNTLNSYRMIDEKRERLQYILEQAQAVAVKAAISNTVSTNMVKVVKLSELVKPILIMSIDSESNYSSQMAEAELNYLKDGWKLDDKEMEVLNEIKEGLFGYSWQIIQENSLPNEYSLDEEDVRDFIEYKNASNSAQALQYFEDHENVYCGFGLFWLTRAELYFEDGNYEKCLEDIKSYESLNISIFEDDYYYAHALPMAIVAAKEMYSEEEYVEAATRYAGLITENTAENTAQNGEWMLNYFAAQTYIDLYTLTENAEYLDKAYESVLNDINCMISTQQSMNEKYLSKIEEIEIPKGTKKSEKNKIKEYNKQIEKDRETELPPVYDPLLLNCELIFDIIEVRGISDTEAERLDAILHWDGVDLFLSEPIDDMFRSNADGEIDYGKAIKFDGETIEIPAKYLADGAKFKITIKQGDKETIIEDWKIEEVEREKEGKLDTFNVVVTSEKAEDFDYKKNAKISIEIMPKEDCETEIIKAEYETVGAKKLLVFNTIKFKKAD